MRTGKNGRRPIIGALFACVTLAALGGCGDLQGDRDVNTDDGEGAIGSGPGLLTGKRGGFVIYNRVWDGAAPNSPNAAE